METRVTTPKPEPLELPADPLEDATLRAAFAEPIGLRDVAFEAAGRTVRAFEHRRFGLRQFELARGAEHHHCTTTLLEIELSGLCQMLHQFLTVPRQAQQALLILLITRQRAFGHRTA
jgi:hypothetical protein